uniref:RAN binding protein 2 n=1 Tax=Gadus morhua TaxID=8049 RepID=A0A8C5BH30_GADMO
MRRSKAEVDRYISSVHSSSPSLKEPYKGFLFAKLYFQAKEYELAKSLIICILQEWDLKAHTFLGQLYEKEGEVDKAVGCYMRSLDLNPAQKDLVLKVAEFLCSKDPFDSRADFWLEKANKLLPGNPAVFNLKEKLLSRQGQQGWNRLFDLLQSELAVRPADVHVNIKLVELYSKDGRLDEAVKHCLSHENKGQLRKSLDWNSLVVDTLQEYLAQPGVSNNEKLCRRLKGELLLAHCNLLRLKLSVSGVLPALDALRSFDEAMRSVSATAGGQTDELCEVFGEMRAHLYLHTGTLLLKMAQEREQNWRAVTDLATLCFLLSYQVPRPKLKLTKGDQLAPQLLELMANDRQSQAGHMLLNLRSDPQTFITEVVEAFGNRIGQSSLFELLFGEQSSTSASFMANDDFGSINTQVPEFSQLAKWDNGSIMLHGGDLQHLSWLGLQWTLLAQRPALRDWLEQLFPRLNLETSQLDTNAPESISLLDLEVFVCGVVFCCHSQLQETAKISCVGQQPLSEPRCLPLPLLRSLSTDRQRDWWDAIYSLIHKQALPDTSAKLRMVVQHGLSSLRAGEKHGLQPSLVISWAQHLSQMGMEVNSYYDQKEYIGRSVHYWKAALPLLDKIKNRRSIPEPLDPLFIHFSNRDIQISIVKGYEEEALIGFASLLDVEGKTEEAISTLETINNVSSSWHLARIYQRLSEEVGIGVEETQDRCIMLLKKFRTYLSKIYNSDDLDQLPGSIEVVMDVLNEVNQQLEQIGEIAEKKEEKGGARRAPTRYSLHCQQISSKTPLHWVEDQKSLLPMLWQQVEALKIEVHLKHNSSGNLGSAHHRMYGYSYGADGLQEPYNPGLSFQAPQLTDPTTGPHGYYNQSPAYNSQSVLRTSANVTPTKFGVPQSEIPGASSFSFAFPIQAGGFQFADQHKETMSTQSIDGTKEEEIALFTGRQDAFSFEDLATSPEDFQFGQNNPTFKGFSRAGENLFSSNQGSPSMVDSLAAQEEEDKTEENDDVKFEPVIQLPEKVDLVTGEEEEQVLYSQRVKLFRFDTGLSQWKERGLGVLKFLKNAANGRLRVLMRREQVLKVCANHWITTTMNLKPLIGSDKAWMWLANDFSDGYARLEQLAAKFKTPELASEFKQKFEECQILLRDIPLLTPHMLVDTGRTAHLIQKAEEIKTFMKDLKCFLTDGKAKLCDESAANLTPANNVMGLTVKPHTEGTGPTLDWDDYRLREPLDYSADISVYASPLASSPVRKNLFRFGESTSGFSFSFQPGISPSKSPAKLNQSGVSVGTDDEQDSTQDEDKDGQYFEPIVPLPYLVEISTGEENEQVVFNHRAKLYRYEKDLNQWKERGIGEIRILQNYDTRRVRLIMRRDQVLKICCNHWITTAMKLEIMKGSEKAWVWSALDFTDAKDGRVEQLAVRFKLQDVANSFKEVFEKAKNAQDSETPITRVTSRVASPPKFVFGTDTLQKIFGRTKSSPEPENYSSNSRTEDNLNVSQSSASPAFKIQAKGKLALLVEHGINTARVLGPPLIKIIYTLRDDLVKSVHQTVNARLSNFKMVYVVQFFFRIVIN